MHLHDYITRIGYTGALTPTRDTLFALHRAHLRAIPYENLDIHLGRALRLDEAHIFRKLVTERRGGWCYEMNGLFAWALRALGFRVTLLGAAVNRVLPGNGVDGDHLCLLVELDEPYLADVGFGDGLIEPIPLRAGSYTQDGFTFTLHQEDARWRFINAPLNGNAFDFTLRPYTMPEFGARCHHLQTSPASGFVRVTVCHRYTGGGYLSLRGAILRETTPHETQTRVIDNYAAYETLLHDQFNLPLPEMPALWEKVWRGHQAWMAEQGG